MSMNIQRDPFAAFKQLSDYAGNAGNLAGNAGNVIQQAIAALTDGTIDAAATSPEAKATEAFQAQFGELAKNKDEFHASMKQIFGDNYDAGKAEQYRQMALKGDYSFLPPVQFVSRETLQGGNGAYSEAEGVIYLADDLKNNPELMQATFIEEAGHHLDAMLNTGDTVGDEGEMFRRVLSGEKLSASDIAEIRAENDKGTITVNGKEIQVEFWNPFKAAKKALKKVGSAISGAAKAVGNAISGAASAIGNAISSVASGIKNIANKVINGALAIGNTVFNAVGKVVEKVTDGVKAVAKVAKKILKPIYNAVAETVKGVGKGLWEVGKGVVNAGKSLYEGVTQGIGGFVSNIVKGNVTEAFRALARGADKAIFGTAGALANGVISGAEQAALGATHLLGPIGKPIREHVIPRVTDIVRTAVNTTLEVGRDVARFAVEAPLGVAEDLGKAVKFAVKGEWGKAFNQLGLAAGNLSARFYGGITDAVLRTVQGLVDIGQVAVGAAPPSRELTEDEIAMLREVYGDSIDYSQVRVKFGGPLNADINGRARVVGNTVYFPGEDANKPIKNADGSLTAYGETLVHEMGHIWQSQNGGGDYIHQALFHQRYGDGYDYQKAIDDGLSFSEMNPEQQAEYIAHELAQYLILPGSVEDNLRASGMTDAEIAYALDAMQHVENGSGTPEGLFA